VRALAETRSVEEVGAVWLPIRLTALLLLMNIVTVWYLRALILTLVGLGLLFPSLLRIAAYWAVVTAVLAAWLIRTWPLADNHHYLAAYWSLSIVIALSLSDPSRALAQSARWLLTFVFLWAALWKGILSPDYTDGRFFTVRLMTDPRFEEHARLFSGLSLWEVRQNRAYLDPLEAEEEALSSDGPRQTAFHTTPRLKFWVTFFTWGVLLAEAGVALAFMLPWGRWTPLIRHGGLMGFSLGTFAFAPVAPFGWLLVTIGLAQVPLKSLYLRVAYVTLWFLIGFVSWFPWEHVVGALDG